MRSFRLWHGTPHVRTDQQLPALHTARFTSCEQRDHKEVFPFLELRVIQPLRRQTLVDWVRDHFLVQLRTRGIADQSLAHEHRRTWPSISFKQRRFKDAKEPAWGKTERGKASALEGAEAAETKKKQHIARTPHPN
jgi:hypothetical protein